MDALVPETITCVDCGGVCRLLSHSPEEGFEVGDVVAYRCTECLDRWDIVVGEAEDPDDGGPAADPLLP